MTWWWDSGGNGRSSHSSLNVYVISWLSLGGVKATGWAELSSLLYQHLNLNASSCCASLGCPLYCDNLLHLLYHNNSLWTNCNNLGACKMVNFKCCPCGLQSGIELSRETTSRIVRFPKAHFNFNRIVQDEATRWHCLHCTKLIITHTFIL